MTDERLKIDRQMVADCREYARSVADGVYRLIAGKTTVSAERAVCRLLGVDGVDDRGVPLPNVITDCLLEESLLADGAWYTLARIMAAAACTPTEAARRIRSGQLDVPRLPHISTQHARTLLGPHMVEGIARIDEARDARQALGRQYPRGRQPWLYVIVATGNIHEDMVQARAAVAQGADVIAVIRSTAQSLLDFVPYGPTTEGFGGTYATQENFRIMRKALNESIREHGRYVQLVNYASGLCMSEIAVTGAFEGLDMMLNDAMYGILFRDINMERTFIDQHFSRMVNAYAGIIINTGEDNYLTTADAVAEGHTVLASQFINEAMARRAGMPAQLMGLGHAFEIDPDREDGFLLELAQAQLVRQIFPDSPVKYMPPTKHMTGNVFRGYLMNGLFNLASIMTDQSIQLLGMLTEAVHTPYIQDRALAIENARHVFNTARHLSGEIRFAPDGIIQRRADQVLGETLRMLADVASTGLPAAIEAGRFASIGRSTSAGKGLSGVCATGARYLNPFAEYFAQQLREGLR